MYQKQEIIYTSFEDTLDENEVAEFDIVSWAKSSQPYKDRVESFIRKNKQHITIQKLRSNSPITQAEVLELEKMLFENDEVGTKEEFIEEYGEQTLGYFIRSIVGLDIKAANEAFSEFIQNGNLSGDQMNFIQKIISFLETNGTINEKMLFKSPFTDISDQGLAGVFRDMDDAKKVISLVREINNNANAG